MLSQVLALGEPVAKAKLPWTVCKQFVFWFTGKSMAPVHSSLTINVLKLPESDIKLESVGEQIALT